MNVEAAPRVLVVEDEEAIAEGLLFNLQRKHYEVDLARDGREALDRPERKRYDLILLDVRLPESGRLRGLPDACGRPATSRRFSC